MYAVGEKGQVVIAKEIRQRLGIRRGWSTVQRLVGDHVEIYFIPPRHGRSLKGSLASYSRTTVSPGAEWQAARQKAWQGHFRKSGAGQDKPEPFE